jgi:hypothetical protein
MDRGNVHLERFRKGAQASGLLLFAASPVPADAKVLPSPPAWADENSVEGSSGN